MPVRWVFFCSHKLSYSGILFNSSARIDMRWGLEETLFVGLETDLGSKASISVPGRFSVQGDVCPRSTLVLRLQSNVLTELYLPGR